MPGRSQDHQAGSGTTQNRVGSGSTGMTLLILQEEDTHWPSFTSRYDTLAPSFISS